MNDDHSKTKQELIEELTAIRRRVDELETLAKEHRQAEEKLRQSEEKYRLITEKMNDSIWTADLELRLTYVSPSDERLFGFTAEERMAQGLGDMLTPASQEKALEILSREWALEEKGQADPCRKVSMELEYYRKDGSTIWVESVVSGIRNDEGVPIGFHGVDRDITERRKSQQTLRESEEKYRRLAESAHEFIVTVDLNFKITYVNRAVLHSTKGMDPVGMSLLHFTPPHLHELQEAIMQKRREGFSDIMSFEWEINLPTGKAATFDIRAALLTVDGKPSEVMFVARDISERKRIEKTLQESEERFRRLAESARDCIWTTDMNLRYTYVSPYIKEGLGYTPEEYMTIPLHETVTPASLDTCMQLLAEELEIEKREDKDPLRSRTMALEQIHKDGHIVWVEIKMTFLRNDAGQAIGILGYTRDITERRKAEAEKEKLKEQLDRARKLESIGTLAGGIAHDFNNLLTGIQGHASLMMLDIDPSHLHHVRLKHIEELVQSGADLTNQLLGFARGGRYAVKPADMNEIVEKTSAMFGRTKKEITIHRKYGKDLWTVEADRSQMEQVFMNLYVNAWHAMPGGGEIYLETANYAVPDEGPLSLTPGKHVKITITDTGTGMDASTLERIFDPFFTTQKMGRGTGLGLATVYGIIKGHGGMIDVSSEPGQGTTFDIYLPATEKALVRAESAEKKVPRGTETILLVDDERMVLEVAREMLQFLGYRVHCAGSGQEAVAVYHEKRNKISLVVLDMIMPSMSGSETFDRLRGIDPGIKVLLSSGYSIDGEAQAIMDRGCNGFLQKPFQMEQLARKVRAALAPEEERP